MAITSTGAEFIESGNIDCPVCGKDRLLTIGTKNARWFGTIAKFQTMACQICPQLRVGRRSHKQYKSRCHDVVNKAGYSDFFTADAPANVIIALQQQNFLAFSSKDRCTHECIDPAANDDVINFAHRYAPSNQALGARASTRHGLPVPCWILIGAAINIAPFGGRRSR